MAYFKANTLNTRNIGSRIGVVGPEHETYGQIASIRQNRGSNITEVYLTDDTDPLRVDGDVQVEIQLSSAELATIATNNAVVDIANSLDSVQTMLQTGSAKVVAQTLEQAGSAL